jgi:hypothetical protein
MEEDGEFINSMEIKRKFLGLDEEYKMFFQVFQEHNDKCWELTELHPPKDGKA